MKIIVNYDLTGKIKEAKEDPKLALLKQQARYYAIVCGLYIACDIAFGYTFRKAVLSSICIQTPALFGINNLVSVSNSNFNIEENKKRITAKQLKAERDLLSLISQLGERNIKTYLELLYEAKEYETKYILLKEEDKVRPMQEKYIMLPTETFTGDRKDISLLQEHIIGSREYVLSLGIPKKATQLKPAFNV